MHPRVTQDNFRQVAQNAAHPLEKFNLKDPEDVTLGGATLAIFGESGAGKTAVAATAIDYFRRPEIIGPHVKTLYLDGEGGLRSIKSRSDFRFQTITKWKEFEEITDALVTTPNIREVHPVIVVDNLSEISEMSMSDVLGGGHGSRAKEEPEWQDWRKNSRIVVTRVRKLRDAARLQRIVVIINLWNRDAQDDAGNVKKTGIDLNPALAKLFAGAVDMVGFLEVPDDNDGSGRRILHLGQSARVKAKFRQDTLDPTVRGIPLDLYGPPFPGVLSLAPLMATLIGGEPFPIADFAAPEGARASKFNSPRGAATATTNSPERISPNGNTQSRTVRR